MEHVVPLLADTGPYKQLLAAENTAQSLQAWIQKKTDATHAIRQQAADQGLPSNAISEYLHMKQLDEEIGQFKQLLECNEASRNHWQQLHMAAWRAAIRPLKVVDMPNEILTNVFSNFEGDSSPQIQFDGSPYDYPLPSPDIASIKNIRLTCRAFCEVASEILLPVVDVSSTRSSLQRLEEISIHPTIWKSVRVLRFHANPYNEFPAKDRWRFIERTHRELWSLRSRLLNDSIGVSTRDELDDALAEYD